MEGGTDTRRQVVGGVDTHKDLHVAAVVDEQDKLGDVVELSPWPTSSRAQLGPEPFEALSDFRTR